MSYLSKPSRPSQPKSISGFPLIGAETPVLLLTELVEDLKRPRWERLIGHKGKTDRLRGQTDDLGPGKNRWTGSKQ